MPLLTEKKSNLKGNLFIRFDIVFPKQLSEEVKAKLRELLKWSFIKNINFYSNLIILN